MSEGELKKRIRESDTASYVEDDETNAYWETDIFKVLDEVAKEFPLMKTVTPAHYGDEQTVEELHIKCVKTLVEIAKWFVKNFGHEKEIWFGEQK